MARFMLKKGDKKTDSKSTTELYTHTRRSSTTTITGERMSTFTDNDTAFWKIGQVKTPMAGIAREIMMWVISLISFYLKCITGSRMIVGYFH